MAWNSDYFDLSNWKITLPVDSKGGISGTAVEVTSLTNYESKYFYDAPDGAMVFMASYDGATTSGSSYARSELREMNGTDRAAWTLREGGTMSATLKIDHMPNYSDGSTGRIVIGQIHGRDQELVRLYYDGGKLYFKNDQAGSSNKEMSFYFKNAQGEEPQVSLGEEFSYLISAKDNTLVVSILADGKVYTSQTAINSVWQSDTFYFKAGVYMGINENNGYGYGQVSFYDLDFGHTAGEGRDAWNAAISSSPDETPPPPLENTGGDVSNTIAGDTGDNLLQGTLQNDVLKGNAGNDMLKGSAGSDTLWGNDGNDTLIGGAGADWLKGGPGRDIFAFQSSAEGGDTIADYVKSQDKIDLSALSLGVTDFGSALKSGAVKLLQVGGNVELRVVESGKETLLATLVDTLKSELASDNFIMPKTGYTVPSVPAPAPIDIANAMTLIGTAINDKLTGGGGNDIINAGAGNDVVYGGGGKDILTGGTGKDMFVFKNIADAGDLIADFRSDDKLDISALKATFQGTSSLDIHQLIADGYISYHQEDDTTHHVYVDIDGSGGPAQQVELATLKTVSWFDSDPTMFA